MTLSRKIAIFLRSLSGDALYKSTKLLNETDMQITKAGRDH